MKAIFPYPVLTGEITLVADEVMVDNTPRPLGLISDREHVIALHEVKGRWNEIRIKVTVTADAGELAAGPWTAPMCVAVVRNRTTKIRHTFELRPEGAGTWRGAVELRKGEQLDACEIDAWVVAEVGGEAGRLIGTARDRWRADFEAASPTQRRSIKMIWKDFTEEANQEFAEFRDDPWLLDAQADEPVLYLNSGVEGLRGVLEHATTTEQKITREVMAAQIASESWAAMFNAALYASGTEDGQVQWPGGWHEDVLRRMLPDLFTDRAPGDALTELVEKRAEGQSGGDLQRRVMHAATLQSRKPKAVASALKSLGRMANAKESV
ncbi:hypothetical protein AF335_14100 [Streptomyces eurocidicus]|uniref:Uncharacterized protein n=1 Tax=Streptomyces eurocidicus TaxID=66423 RepID=A0A2N8NYP4_STREU|nr:hypothetical protein [Streptomyces eurocidicus]MBB5121475.1 hypothetical protein [Streptomyces eurocidicus]MBF6051077.1 hypothetical protein [Streptomyces eurocidicus]PNE33894.1 hypothetical protein AF335_14100 [Streptomyces eurocidicus]